MNVVRVVVLDVERRQVGTIREMPPSRATMHGGDGIPTEWVDGAMTQSQLESRRESEPSLWRGRLIGIGLAAVVVLAVVFGAPPWLAGTVRAVAAYDAGTIAVLVLIWTRGMHHTAEKTQRRAKLEDPGRNVVLGVVLVSIAVGFVAAISILGRGPHVTVPLEKNVTYGLGILAVIVGWVFIHTMFTVRYAHLFYYDDDDDSEADRGLTFPGDEDPSDYDFAYFSFVVGMTFQVSDVQVTDPGVRRVVLFHGLISFAYNTAILALGINIISGLLHG